MTEQPGHILDPDVIAELHAGPPQVEVLEAVEVHRRYGSHEVLRGSAPLPAGFRPKETTIQVMDRAGGRSLGRRVMLVR